MTAPTMTVWRTVGGFLHRRASCSGGPGIAGVRQGRQWLAKVTRADYDAADVCRCLSRGGWKADTDRSPGDLAHTKRR